MKILGVVTATALVLGMGLWLDRIPSPGPQPEGIASDGTFIWVADFIDGTISRIDPAAPDRPLVFASPGPHPEGLTWDGSHLWSADWETRRIYRHAVSDTAIPVVSSFDSPRPESWTRPVGLTWDGSALWLTTWYPFMLYRLDPTDGHVLASRDIAGLYPPLPPFGTYAPEDLAWDGAHLWITDWYTAGIHRFDPVTYELLESVDSPGPRSVGLTFHLGFLWNGDTEEQALYRLEVTGGTATRRVTWGGLKRGTPGANGP